MSFETFAVAVVILLFMAVVAVVCISLGYAGKKRGPCDFFGADGALLER